MNAPAIFLAHGAPSVALDDTAFTRAVSSLGSTLDVDAIVIVSAHWQTRGGARVNAVERPEVIYDFGGFSPELYSMRYDAAGHPSLAREVASLIGAELETSRGWDHGVWIPLRILRPAADIPIVEVSLPDPATSEELLRIGRALGPLRDRNVAIIGSGGIVHNLRRINLGNQNSEPEEWAVAFDSWVASHLPDLSGWERAPHASLAVPTPEHFEPVFVVLGAARAEDELVPIHAGIEYGSLSMHSFAFMPESAAGANG